MPLVRTTLIVGLALLCFTGVYLRLILQHSDSWVTVHFPTLHRTPHTVAYPVTLVTSFHAVPTGLRHSVQGEPEVNIPQKYRHKALTTRVYRLSGLAAALPLLC